MLNEKDREEGKARWYHWVRMLMGFKPSPYISVKRTLIVEEIVRGDQHYVDNLSHWTTTRLNLPGSVGYDPSKPWLSKIRADGRVAADLFSFVDDETQKGRGLGGRQLATRTLQLVGQDEFVLPMIAMILRAECVHSQEPFPSAAHVFLKCCMGDKFYKGEFWGCLVSLFIMD